MEKDRINILSWRVGAVVLPWLTILSIFFTGMSKYYKANEIISVYPKDIAEIKAAVAANDRRIFVVERAVIDFSEKMQDLKNAVDRINSKLDVMTRRREN